MSAHMIGPWEAIPPNYSAEGIAFTIYPLETSEPLAEVIARNGAKQIAQLMAAAPELLLALQAIVKSLADQDDEGMIEHAQQMIDARAAIAKATGAAPGAAQGGGGK